MKFWFVINPISGTGATLKVADMVKKHLAAHEVEIHYTQARGHAGQLALDGLAAGAHRIVAVGGDGTMNEVASALVGTSGVLALIPCGSGNGLARHLKLPLNQELAVKSLPSTRAMLIDSCELNGKPFFNVAGIGFDAGVAHSFAQMGKRGPTGYVTGVRNEWKKHRSSTAIITVGGVQTQVDDMFLISFANTSQYGNNAYIAPGADVRDGLAEICIIKKFPGIMVPGMTYRLFSKKLPTSRYVTIISAAEALIESPHARYAHLDGEPVEYDTDLLRLRVLPQSLWVAVPAG